MPDRVSRFTISVPPELLASFDEVSASKGYSSRSEAVRDALRDYLVAHNWIAEGENATSEVAGTITLVFDHEIRNVATELLERQRHSGASVLSTLFIPLDGRNCLGVVAIRGRRADVAALADCLISLHGVKFGRLTHATTGDGIA